MIDYYEELSLSRKLDTKQIQEELVRLESLWHKREVNSPEKANKMLGIIMDAQKVFASEASRKKYDNDLEASLREPEDPDVSRSKSLEKWTGQAKTFYNDGQYDLAKASIDRALNYIDSEFDNGDLFRLAADIYLENNDIRLSLECINKAIISSPDWADYYIVKARIYERMSLTEQQYDKRQNDIKECRNNLMNAVSIAKASGDIVTEGDALGMLAFSLYFHLNPDVALAEEYANRAEALGERANSKRVLDDIAEKKNSPIYNEAKKEEGYGNLQHLREALRLYESLGDWKDASERAAACRTRIGQLEEAEVRRQQEEQRRREEQARKAKEAEEERKRRAQAELEAQRKKKEQTIKFVKTAAPIAAAAVVVMILINSFFIPNGKYHSALNLMKSGNYDEAITAFRSLNGFRSSEKKIDECYDAISQGKYDAAVELMNEGKYEEAIAAFDALGDYGDSVLQASSCKDAIMQLQYGAAVGLMEEGKYEEAIAAFEKIGDYEDSIAFVAESRNNINQMAYDAVMALKSEGKYEEAISAFENLGSYSDSSE